MARLIVEAQASRSILETQGQKSHVHVGASVSDENGNPLKGLSKSNFTVAKIGGPGQQIAIFQVTERSIAGGSPVDGFYTLFVGLADELPWPKGVSVHALVVSRSYSRGTDRGQTLFRIEIAEKP